METRPPTFGRIAIAAGFALSCFGLLLFLWLAFGGPVPLKPKSYRFDVHFDEASQLAVESDVRISGVSVGKVKGIELADDGLADATIEIDPKYAPIPTDTRTMLRQKTLLGETYVELTPGNKDAPPLPEGGTLANANVSDAVQLDEIFRAFDEPTRAAFQTWMADAAVAFKGRGIDLNAALGNLDQFAERGDDLLRVLDSQRLAVKKLLADGGATFDAISKQPDQLRGADQQHRGGLLDDRRPRHRDPRDLPGAADLPRRVEADAEPPRRVLDRHQSAGHAAAARRPPAQRHVPGAATALAGARAVLQRPAPGDQEG